MVNKLKKIFLYLLGLILLVFIYSYASDVKSIAKAKIVKVYIENYCDEQKIFPTLSTYLKEFPDLTVENNWFYWISKDRKYLTVQYPMTLWLPSAPGKLKIAEFIPTIYAFTMNFKCYQ